MEDRGDTVDMGGRGEGRVRGFVRGYWVRLLVVVYLRLAVCFKRRALKKWGALE